MKSIQAIATASLLFSINKIDKVLISCPKNVLYQWGREIEKFSNYSYQIVDGYSKDKRLECYDNNCDFFVINHDLLIIEEDFQNLKLIGFDMLIADEVHHFKNRSAQRSQAAKELAKNIDYKLGLTGTPLQNRPEDAFSVFELLIPEYLGDWNDFSSKYICWRYLNNGPRPVGYKNLGRLGKKISNKMIRRESADISDDLPNVNQKDHYVEQDSLQERMSQQIIEVIDNIKHELSASHNTSDEVEEKEEMIMGLRNCLIMISDDPRLVNYSDSNFMSSLGPVSENYTPNKIIKLKKLLQNILNYNDDFKVVIFTKFLKMLNIINRELNKLNCIDNIVSIHGGVSNKQRNKNVEEFTNKKDRRVITCTDAAAEGLDLQVASHLINYDLPWSPARLDQRNGRIRRIGSSWNNIYISNIITRDSIDERIKDIISRKRDMYDILVSNTSSQKEALNKFVNKNIAS